LAVFGRFRDYGDLIGNQEGRVETDTELSNHGDISSLGKSLHEGLGSRLGDGSQVGDELLLGHADTGIAEGEGVVVLVGDDVDLEALLVADNVGVGEGSVPDLIEGIRGIGDELSEEDLLVGVEGVDDEAHQLLDVSVEGKVLSGSLFSHLDIYYLNDFC
jgi:hypothetical protein